MWRFFSTNRTGKILVLSTKKMWHSDVSVLFSLVLGIVLNFAALDVETAEVPRLSFGLERVLFK